MTPPQIHHRLDTQQVRTILTQYVDGVLDVPAAIAQLGVKRARFFKILKAFRKDPDNFTVEYQRTSASRRIAAHADALIRVELQKQKQLIEMPAVPIDTFNYSVIRDKLRDKHEIAVSLSPIIARAKETACYIPRKARRLHDREVLTNYIGELVQHDSSHHLFSPYATDKWYLITSIDDCSRHFLFADFWEHESSWVHIEALRSLVTNFGCPQKFYIDQHAIFRYVARRDSFHYRSTIFTDDTDPQWKQVLLNLGIEPIYALSPQAKGKVERPYRWMQDRIVRRCAEEHVTHIEDGRRILQDEVKRYGQRQVHSTTGEIPLQRFNRLRTAGRTMFHPYRTPAPYDPLKDVFCLRLKRVVDAYHKISLFRFELQVPKVPPREKVTIHLVPNASNQLVEVRLWWHDTLVSTQNIRAEDLPGVYF